METYIDLNNIQPTIQFLVHPHKINANFNEIFPVQAKPNQSQNRTDSGISNDGDCLSPTTDDTETDTKMKRKPRTIFTHSQVKTLQAYFEQTPYLGVEQRDNLAEYLGLTPSQVKIWFQNKRSKLKKIIQRENVRMRQSLDFQN